MNQINSNYCFTYYQFIYTRKSNQFISRSLINVIATFKEVVKKIQIKFKILDLAVKENERITSRNRVNELVKQQKAFEKCLDEINDPKVAAEEFMLEDDKSLGEVKNWVKLHNKAVLKYDAYLEEIEIKLNYITK